RPHSVQPGLVNRTPSGLDPGSENPSPFATRALESAPEFTRLHACKSCLVRRELTDRVAASGCSSIQVRASSNWSEANSRTSAEPNERLRWVAGADSVR